MKNKPQATANRLLSLIQANASGQTNAPLAVVRNATTGVGESHIYLYDVIDAHWGISAKSFVDALNSVPDGDVLHVHINSPGGDVFEGRAMAATLAARIGGSVVHIEGLAASAATTVATAGTQVRISAGSLFMVHNSWTMAWGNKDDLADTIKLLALVDRQISGDYERKTGASAEQIKAWMDAETWFDADAALAAKFVDVIDTPPARKADDPSPAAKAWSLSAYNNAPQPTAPITQAAAPQPSSQAIADQRRAQAARRLELLQLC